VLVIEDEELIRESVVHLLKTRGFEVIAAVDGYTGVQLALTLVPNLILCDMKMPGLNGSEVLIAVRTNPITVTIPFIFLTAQTSIADLEQEQNIAADGYLTKPFTTTALLEAISKCLRQDTET
jgi:CheY-like chemotaxis protein